MPVSFQATNAGVTVCEAVPLDRWLVSSPGP